MLVLEIQLAACVIKIVKSSWLIADGKSVNGWSVEYPSRCSIWTPTKSVIGVSPILMLERSMLTGPMPHIKSILTNCLSPLISVYGFEPKLGVLLYLPRMIGTGEKGFREFLAPSIKSDGLSVVPDVLESASYLGCGSGISALTASIPAVATIAVTVAAAAVAQNPAAHPVTYH